MADFDRVIFHRRLCERVIYDEREMIYFIYVRKRFLPRFQFQEFYCVRYIYLYALQLNIGQWTVTNIALDIKCMSGYVIFAIRSAHRVYGKHYRRVSTIHSPVTFSLVLRTRYYISVYRIFFRVIMIKVKNCFCRKSEREVRVENTWVMKVYEGKQF